MWLIAPMLANNSSRSQAVRFLLVGCSNAALSYVVLVLVFPLLKTLPMGGAISQAISYSTGIAWSFALNRRFTFAVSQEARAAPQMARFIATQLSLLLVSSGLIEFSLQQGWSLTPSWLVVMALVTVANFLLSKYWVFRSRAG
ncbi:GtrA family protein [Kordiimonas sp.]|uniref:GtrA family protein n=1 Tax=Kordiimonas sp. TaxID=1970157 RepID=UPI003A8E1FA6